MRLHKFHELFYAVSLVFLSACSPPISVEGIFPDSVPITRLPPPAAGEKFLPEHRRILELTGWYNYADSNIDQLEYFDWQAFSHPRGLAIGQAIYFQGRRIARIAIKDRSDAEVCEIIIHEAAHLSGVQQIGQMFGEEEAEATEAKFRQQRLSLNQR
jgi:hypothetical protein